MSSPEYPNSSSTKKKRGNNVSGKRIENVTLTYIWWSTLSQKMGHVSFSFNIITWNFDYDVFYNCSSVEDIHLTSFAEFKFFHKMLNEIPNTPNGVKWGFIVLSCRQEEGVAGEQLKSSYLWRRTQEAVLSALSSCIMYHGRSKHLR